MTQTQFLILLIAIIPFFNCLIIKLCADSPKLINAFSKFLPILFFVNLIGLYGNLGRDNSYLVLTESVRGIVLGFDVDQIAVVFLFLFNFLWLIFAFYSQRFLEFYQEKNLNNFKYFFALIIAFVNLIIISKNLLSILFFYNCLIILSHFFAAKFLHKQQSKFSNFFTFLLYLESIFLFFAIVATYKFTGQIDFVLGGIISEKLNSANYVMLLILYLSGLFLSLLFPSYLLYRNINLDPIIIYALFFLAYAFSAIYIFIKLLGAVFGFTALAAIIFELGNGIIFQIIQWIFLLNIAATSWFLVFNKGLKSSFFYLFFQQFLVALFTILLFAIFDESKIYLTVVSFVLSLTLVFLTISNFVLYLKKSDQKWFGGIFYDLKITTVLFVFAIVNLIGLAPAIGAIEKFFLLKIIFQKELIIAGVIFGINFFSLIAFAWKIFYTIFLPKQKSENISEIKHNEKKAVAEVTKEVDKENDLAKEIDLDSSLILTPLIVGVMIFLGLILFPILTKFL